MRYAILIASCAVIMVGCARRPAPQDQTEPAIVASDQPVIVHLVGRDRTITIKSSSKGMLYSMHDEQGKVVLADATARQFETQYPELYLQLRDRAIATVDDVRTQTKRSEPAMSSGPLMLRDP